MASRVHAGRHWPSVFIQLAVASAVCVALIVARVRMADDPGLSFLVWNLVLAWVPFVLAVALHGGYRHGAPGTVLVLLGALWLLFLPNAPYIITDFVHVGAVPGVPEWFDALVIGAFATTGLLLGFGSIYLVQAVTAERFGHFTVWAFVSAVIALSSVGVYLGRVHRLNSWDAVTDPGELLSLAHVRLLDPLENERLLAVVVALTAALFATYLILYAVILPMVGYRRRQRRAARAR